MTKMTSCTAILLLLLLVLLLATATATTTTTAATTTSAAAFVRVGFVVRTTTTTTRTTRQFGRTAATATSSSSSLPLSSFFHTKRRLSCLVSMNPTTATSAAAAASAAAADTTSSSSMGTTAAAADATATAEAIVVDSSSSISTSTPHAVVDNKNNYKSYNNSLDSSFKNILFAVQRKYAHSPLQAAEEMKRVLLDYYDYYSCCSSTPTNATKLSFTTSSSFESDDLDFYFAIVANAYVKAIGAQEDDSYPNTRDTTTTTTATAAVQSASSSSTSSSFSSSSSSLAGAEDDKKSSSLSLSLWYRGAQRVEDWIQLYQTVTKRPPTVVLKTAAMNAWKKCALSAMTSATRTTSTSTSSRRRNNYSNNKTTTREVLCVAWKNIDTWFQSMSSSSEQPQQQIDTVAYTCYLEAMAVCAPVLPPQDDDIGSRSMQILAQMKKDTTTMTMTNQQQEPNSVSSSPCRPNTFTYIALMKCMAAIPSSTTPTTSSNNKNNNNDNKNNHPTSVLERVDCILQSCQEEYSTWMQNHNNNNHHASLSSSLNSCPCKPTTNLFVTAIQIAAHLSSPPPASLSAASSSSSSSSFRMVAAEQACRWLEQWHTLWTRSSHCHDNVDSDWKDFAVTENLYTAVFTTLSKVVDSSFAASWAAQKVNALLVQMERNFEQLQRLQRLQQQKVQSSSQMQKKNHHRAYSVPGIQVYTAAMTAKVMDPASVGQAEDILRKHVLPRGIQPDAVTYQCLIKAYSRIGNAAKADQFLWEWHDAATKRPLPINQDSRTLSTTISSSSPTPQQRQHRLLPKPDAVTVASVILAWVKESKTGSIDVALDKAMPLLNLITDEYLGGANETARAESNTTVIPMKTNMNKYRRPVFRGNQRIVESWIYEEVIRLWSLSRRPNAGSHAERLINTMIQLNQTLPMGQFAPSVNTFILTLDAWSSSGRKDAGVHALNLLEKMESLEAQGFLPAGSVNARALSSALLCVSNAGGKSAAETSVQLFRRLVQLQISGDRSASIEARVATCVLSTIVRNHAVSAPVDAIAMLHEITKLSEKHSNLRAMLPNTIVYNSVLSGLAQRGMPHEAEQLLQEMKIRSARGQDCAPDIVTISCVCRAHASSDVPNSGEKAKAYLDQVNADFLEGNANLKPDTLLYNACLQAYANDAKTNADAALRADELLREMEKSIAGDMPIRPDLVSFSTVCQAFAKSDTLLGTERAESVVERAEQFASDGHMDKPELAFYASVILSFTRSKAKGSMARAEKLFLDMEDLATREGRADAKPNTRVYNTLLSGWATSSEPDRFERTVALFQRMWALYEAGDTTVKPDVYSHNWVILAAARAPDKSREGRRAHFDLAVKEFRAICGRDEDHGRDTSEALHPNSFTYSYFLKACRAILPPGEEREKLIRKTFELCKERKLVSKEVLGETYMALPSLLEEELKAAGVVTFDLETAIVPRIPTAWCSNLPTRRRIHSIDLKRWNSVGNHYDVQ